MLKIELSEITSFFYNSFLVRWGGGGSNPLTTPAYATERDDLIKRMNGKKIRCLLTCCCQSKYIRRLRLEHYGVQMKMCNFWKCTNKHHLYWTDIQMVSHQSKWILILSDTSSVPILLLDGVTSIVERWVM